MIPSLSQMWLSHACYLRMCAGICCVLAQKKKKSWLLHNEGDISAELAPASTALLTAIRSSLMNVTLSHILEDILSVLDDDAHNHRQAFMNRTQHCFAIKNGADGLLDTARARFCSITEQIYQLLDSYRETIDPALKV